MGFAEQVSLDLDRVEFRDWGETVTYTPSGGDAQSITAIVLRQEQEVEPTENGLEIRRRVPVKLMISDVASPARGDAISFPVKAGGTAVAWNVLGDPHVPGDGTATITAYRREPQEKSAEGHRLDI